MCWRSVLDKVAFYYIYIIAGEDCSEERSGDSSNRANSFDFPGFNLVLYLSSAYRRAKSAAVLAYERKLERLIVTLAHCAPGTLFKADIPEQIGARPESGVSDPYNKGQHSPLSRGNHHFFPSYLIVDVSRRYGNPKPWDGQAGLKNFRNVYANVYARLSILIRNTNQKRHMRYPWWCEKNRMPIERAETTRRVARTTRMSQPGHCSAEKFRNCEEN